MGATEIAHHIFFCVAALLMGDDDTTLRAKCGQAARHGSIVGKAAISMQLNPIRKAPFDVVHGEGPLRVPRDLHPLPRRDRKSTRLNSSHSQISYAVFCLKKKKIICQ